MPIILLGVIAALAIFFLLVGAIIIITDQADVGLPFFIIAIVIIIFAGSWIYISYDQDIAYVNYQMSKRVLFDNGKQIDQVVTVDGVIINLNKKYNCIIPEKSIVKVYRLNPWKNGIHWMNGSIDRCELHIPNSPEYKEALNKVNKNGNNKKTN